MAEFINVKVGKLPGKIEEYALNGDQTVKAALAVAGLDPAGFEIRVNGSPATVDMAVGHNSTVLLLKKIKGNVDFINVKVGKLPGKIEEYALNGDRTVAAALAVAGLDPAGFEIRVNGSPATVDMAVGNNSTVLLLKKIKGN